MMTRMKTVQVWTVVLALAAGVTPTAAQGPSAPQVAQGAQTPQTAQVAPTELGSYVVGQAKPPDLGRPMLDMTMEQAIQRALEHNLNIQIQKLNPAISDYTLQQTRATYRPTLTGTFGYNNASQASTSSLDGGALVTTTKYTYNSGLSETLPWYGESATMSFNNGRSFTNNSFTNINPSFSSGLAFTFNQPILHNLSTDPTRITLKTEEIARLVTDSQLRTSIENTIASVRNAYWNLRETIEAIEIAKEGLAQAHQLVEDNNTKVTIGTLAPLDVLSAQSAEATQKVAVTQAISSWQTTELVLKQLIVGGQDDDAFKATINPTEHPDFTQVTPDIPAAIATALAERTDLDQARKTLQESALNVKLLQNATLPDLNLATGYAVNGVGGPSISSTTKVVTPGGYYNALASVFGLDIPTWSATVNFTYPLGMAAARANLARTKLGYDQSVVTLKASELGVATAVTNAALAVQNGFQTLQTSTVARQLADQTAQAERSKFEVGLSTNYNVELTLTNLNSARLQELNAMITYIKAVIEFERVQHLGGSS
jgi:outer membrane protein TolC